MTDKSPNNKQHFCIKNDIEQTALELLFNSTGLAKQALKQYAQQGAVWVTRNTKSKPERLRRLKKMLLPGQVIDFYYYPDLLNEQPAIPTLIADFIEYSVWLKPRGMLSQGSKWADHTALYRWVEQNYQPEVNGKKQIRQAWIVHRLDRATQGIMLLAHSKKMAAKLSQLFETNQIHKSYQANVCGQYPKEIQTIDLAIDGKTAISYIVQLRYEKQRDISRVHIDIETGRKHQIRRHLSETGFPIIGDRLYGNEKQDKQFDCRPNLQLTAYKLNFDCPITGEAKMFRLEEPQLDLLSAH
ncbi:RluA family pseudouridine synthase [Thiomicrorhabdus hydrogeniphila]